MKQFAQLNFDVIKARPLFLPRRLVSYVLFEGRPLFSRARWVNWLVFNQLKMAKSLPLKSKVEKPIFILGMGRSGTTIMGNIFFLHPYVGLLHEPKALWNSIFPKEDLLGNYSQDPAYYRLDQRMVTPEVKRSAHRIYTFYLTLTGTRRVVDKSPDFVFRVPFLREIFPDAKFIFLIRDGRDTIRSVSSWSRQHDQHNHNDMHFWWGAHKRKWKLLLEQIVPQDDLLRGNQNEISTFTRDMDMAAVEWICSTREGIRHMQTMSEMLYQLNYNDLVRYPEKNIKDLLDFCELPYDNTMIEYSKKALAPLPPKKEAVTLHPAIFQPFVDTMQAIGYSTDQLQVLSINR